MTQPVRAIASTAVVVGGSFAGLLAARALALYFRKVLVIERAQLTNGELLSPQPGHHYATHSLATSGVRSIARLFSDFPVSLASEGAAVLDPWAQSQFSVAGQWLPRFTSQTKHYYVTRGFLDRHLRRQLKSDPRVQVLSGRRATALRLSPDRTRVLGIELGDTLLSADLVVDCTGRAAFVPAELRRQGISVFSEDCNFRYSYVSATVQNVIPKNAFWRAIMIEAGPPAFDRAGFLLPVEHGLWQLSLVGYGETEPPTEARAFLEWATSLASRSIAHALREAQLAIPPKTFRSNRGRWNRFTGQAQSPPIGVLVLGDAACSFDPVHGHGLSVAAKQAVLLDRSLSQLREWSDTTARKLANDFFRSSDAIIAPVWIAAKAHASPAQSRGLLLRVIDASIARAWSHNPSLIERVYCLADEDLIVPPKAYRKLVPEILRGILNIGRPIIVDEDNHISDSSMYSFRKRRIRPEMTPIISETNSNQV